MYEGNTKDIAFVVEGTLYPSDKIEIRIKKDLDNFICIYKEEFTEIEDNAFVFCIDEKVTKLLKAGRYFWGAIIYRVNGETKTIVANEPFIVKERV